LNSRGLQTRVALLTGLLAFVLVGCVARLGTGWAGVTVLEGGTQIAFAYENTLSVIDVASGEPIEVTDEDGDTQLDANGEPLVWQINGNDYDNAKFFAEPLQISEDTLLVTTLDRRLFLVGLDTTQLQGVLTEPIEGRGNAVTRPIIEDETLLMGLSERLVALDSSFDPIWTIGTEHGVWAEPLVMGDVVYFTSLDHFMYAADVATGDVIWSLDLGGAAAAVPVYDPEREVFYVGTFGSKVLKITSDGNIEAEFETGEWVWGEPTLLDGRLYVADLSGAVYNLDPDTLTLDGEGWESQVATGAIRTPPVVFDDYVVVASRDQSVYWLDRESGNEIFNRPLDGEILSDILYFPADEDKGLEESLIIVSTLSNRESLVAFGAENGERIWTYRR
jgi:outer membrane protein assembly factor BamB